MGNIGSKIVEVEWLSDLVSELAWGGHSLELKSHNSSGFEVSELEVASGHAGVGVEESPGFVVVFGELFSIDGGVIFTVVVQDVDGLLVEEFGDFLVFVDHISQVSFLEVGVVGSVSDTDVQQSQGQEGEDLESESNVGELVEENGGTRQDVDTEVIVDSVSSVPPGLKSREPSQDDVLNPVVEKRDGGLGVFWLSNFIVLGAVSGVAVIGVLELVLPTFIVRGRGLPRNLVTDGDVDKGGVSEGSQGVGIVEDDLLGAGLGQVRSEPA